MGAGRPAGPAGRRAPVKRGRLPADGPAVDVRWRCPREEWRGRPGETVGGDDLSGRGRFSRL